VDAAALDRYSRGFAQEWADDAARIDAQLCRLEAVPVAALVRGGSAGLAGYLELALSAHREAWRVHFATRYRLLAVHGYVRGELRALGLDEVTAAGLLQGEENAVLAGDHELRVLAAAAREQELAGLFESPGPGLVERVRSRGEAGRWWTAFEAFLARHGNRGEAGAELTVPAWNEDPEPALALVRRELLEGTQPAAASGSAHRLRAGVAGVAGVAEAAETAERVRARLTPQARPRFDIVYRLARRANFAWWNEEHNVLIDLRAHLPVRRAALAASAVLGLPRPDDALYLHVEELAAVLAGDAGRLEPAGTADQRRTYVEQWRARRPDLPVRLGSGGDGRDPVLQEILGAGSGAGAGGGVGAGAGGGVVLTGLGVSRGRARGPARVLAAVIDLADVRTGEDSVG
jgi:pyruvate,water dikinase